MQVTIAEAKAKFSELIRMAEAGEPVILTRYGRPVVELHATGVGVDIPLIGAMKGKIQIADDFDEMPETFMARLSASVEPE